MRWRGQRVKISYLREQSEQGNFRFCRLKTSDLALQEMLLVDMWHCRGLYSKHTLFVIMRLQIRVFVQRLKSNLCNWTSGKIQFRQHSPHVCSWCVFCAQFLSHAHIIYRSDDGPLIGRNQLPWKSMVLCMLEYRSNTSVKVTVINGIYSVCQCPFYIQLPNQ